MPVLFGYGINRFSHDVVQLISGHVQAAFHVFTLKSTC